MTALLVQGHPHLSIPVPNHPKPVIEINARRAALAELANAAD
jgi:hypothetical protein